MRRLERAYFTLTQNARTAWYGAQYALAQRLAPPIHSRPKKPGTIIGWGPILRDMANLRQQDWRNVEAGYYPRPRAMMAGPRALLKDAARFFQDIPAVNLRRRLKSNSEVFDAPNRSKRPRYYLQNFHYQSGGWMSDDSAALYDHQVEVLFTGSADAMRRQALRPLGDWLRVNGSEGRTLLDIASGTGRVLIDMARAHPNLNLIGLDMSEAYLAKANRDLAAYQYTALLGQAEALPFEDAKGPDLITSVYLFHELPRKIRHQALREIARVLPPGGRAVLVDSLQRGDHPPYDTLLESFPSAMHEPYYLNYIEDDLEAVLSAAGLVHVSTTRAFFSRVMTFDKPA